MKDIKDILKSCYSNNYRGFILLSFMSKEGKKVFYNIYNQDFRKIYQGRFTNRNSARSFIDKNFLMLLSVSNV